MTELGTDAWWEAVTMGHKNHKAYVAVDDVYWFALQKWPDKQITAAVEALRKKREYADRPDNFLDWWAGVDPYDA